MMNYIETSYGFILIILTIQSSVTQRDDPIVAQMKGENVMGSSEELHEAGKAYFRYHLEAEEAIIDEKHRSWKSCLASDRSRIQCNALYESLLREEKPLVRLKHYHGILEKDFFRDCRQSTAGRRSTEECILEKEDIERRISIMERELYPWTEIHKMCIAALDNDKCNDILEEIQIPRYRNLVPESLITIAKAHICLDAGRSEEDCQEEAMAHYNQVVAPKDEL